MQTEQNCSIAASYIAWAKENESEALAKRMFDEFDNRKMFEVMKKYQRRYAPFEIIRSGKNKYAVVVYEGFDAKRGSVTAKKIYCDSLEDAKSVRVREMRRISEGSATE